MSESIFVPLDGTPESERALEVAVPLARTMAMPLVLIWVWEGLHGLDRALPAEDQVVIDQAQRERRATQLMALRDRVVTPAGVEAAVVVPQGRPTAEILHAAAHHQAHYLVMTTHGRDGFQRWNLGSVADEISRASARPTILYHPVIESPFPGRFARILAPLDGSAQAETVLREAVMLVRATHGTLVLLTVAGADLTTDEARAYLDQVRADFPDVGVETVVDDGDPAAVIAGRAADADLVAIATHGRGGWRRLVLGSVAAAVVSRCGVPVMLVRRPAG